MNRHITLLLALLTIILYSCAEHSTLRDRLYKAESVMEADPKSAMAILDSICTDQLSNDSDKALFALLYSQARDKNYIDVTDDSLVNIAVTYYTGRSDDLHKERANYYLACVKCNAGNYAAGMTAVSEALRIAKALDDDREIARAYELMADLHNATYNSSRSLHYRYLTRQHYRKARLPRETAYSELDLAIGLYNDRQYNRSIVLIDSLMPTINGDSLFQAHCLSALVRPLLYTADYRRAAKVLAQLKDFTGIYSLTCQDYANLAELYLYAGDIDKAQFYIERSASLSPEAIQPAIARYRLQLKEGAGDSLIADYRRIACLQDSIMGNVMRQTVTAAEAEYAGTLTETANNTNEKLRHRSIIAIILLATIAAGVIIALRIKLAVKNAEIRHAVADISDISRQLSESLAETTQLHARVETLFRERFKTLDRLCNEYFEALDAPSSHLKTAIYNNIVKMLTDMRKPAETDRLKKLVNENMDSIISRIETQLPQLDSSDIAFITYIYAGFSTKAVCMFTGITKGNFYMRRRRLRSAISRSNAHDRDLFLSHL